MTGKMPRYEVNSTIPSCASATVTSHIHLKYHYNINCSHLVKEHI